MNKIYCTFPYDIYRQFKKTCELHASRKKQVARKVSSSKDLPDLPPDYFNIITNP